MSTQPLDDGIQYHGEIEPDYILPSILTMRSARSHKIDDINEVRNELVAQYLVNGRVKLKQPSAVQTKMWNREKDSYDVTNHTPKQKINPNVLRQYAQSINQAIDEQLAKAVGTVIYERY